MEQNLVIVLSDDDDDDDCSVHNNSSVLIVEDSVNKQDAMKTNEVLDEDLAITFSQKADVLPHARYDCTIPFCPTESDVSGPVERNEAFCEQCFCYVCDKQAAKCIFWSIPGMCHCNAHKRSVYWKGLRDKSIMGYLHELNFRFDLLEIDADLRRAESSLQEFSCRLALEYATFLKGEETSLYSLIGCNCSCHPPSHNPAGGSSSNNNMAGIQAANSGTEGCRACQDRHLRVISYDYTCVYECVLAFLDAAIRENPKTSAVLLLGAAKLFITHNSPNGNTNPKCRVSDCVPLLLWRVVTKVESLLVFAEFSESFVKQLQSFFQALPLPLHCRSLRNSLKVLPWDDPLLSAVMRGQNISGERKVKGRRTEVLCEPIAVVQARVHKLQQQNKYRELARYLKVVRSYNNEILQALRDLVPLYLCKVGDYMGAVSTMFSPMGAASCPASRLTPPQFTAYLRILTSGHAPSDLSLSMFSVPGHASSTLPDPLLSPQWTPVTGCNLLKKMEVLKFALKVLNCNTTVFAKTSRDVTFSVLMELNTAFRIHIPKTFQTDQAMLLLATQALALRILQSRLSPILNVIMAFKLNPWALHWLYYRLVGQPDVLHVLLCSVLEELFEERHKPPAKVKDASEHSFIANFIGLFFQDCSLTLNHNSYPTNELLASWNESACPWQFNLRQLLEFSVRDISIFAVY
ncbi:uncharacterized protein LOC115816050 [Chanos chanos]|uniref:Uncharacterized protein LOC115816050 n=1 Tax=Chanos chanos TaxID=29144 RepID=A0A6J2VUL1_CHACN|nr:uncharacterized protein LOC115816050 [Chanos chanos]